MIAFFILVVAAVFNTIHFNRGDTHKWMVIKAFGVFVSSVFIIGIIQGVVTKNKSPGYSNACIAQAAAGITAFTLPHIYNHILVTFGV